METTLWLERPDEGTGVQLVDPRRAQPFAVWFRGLIERFCATRREADAVLIQARQEAALGLREDEEYVGSTS